MPDETTPPPAAVVPTPVPATAERRPGPRDRRVSAATPPPAAPGPVAGHAIGPVTRRDLPPGIPPGIGGLLQTSATPAVPVEPRHPTFAPIPPATLAVRAMATTLRTQLIAATQHGQTTLAVIDQALVKFATADAATLAAEGIDIDRVRQFRAAVQAALDLTQ